jgi:hypothetical protein
MHKYAILRGFLLILLASCVWSCKPTHTDLKEAIREYYTNANRTAGAGAFTVTHIEILDHNRDANLVLAKVSGYHHNHSTPTKKSATDQLDTLWFFYKKSGSQVQIVKIATAYEVEEETLQKY